MRVSAVFPCCLSLLAAAGLLAGCAANRASTMDPDSRFYRLQPGSKFILNKEVSIGAERATAYFQQGMQTGGLDNYAVGCELLNRKLGPVTIEPDTFVVRRAESSREWISWPNIMRFYRVIYLESDSQPDVMKMECQTWDGPMWPSEITLPQIREALGEVFTLELESPR